jgi:hypothetical protein
MTTHLIPPEQIYFTVQLEFFKELAFGRPSPLSIYFEGESNLTVRGEILANQRSEEGKWWKLFKISDKNYKRKY